MAGMERPRQTSCLFAMLAFSLCADAERMCGKLHKAKRCCLICTHNINFNRTSGGMRRKYLSVFVVTRDNARARGEANSIWPYVDT